MQREYPAIPCERSADDIVVHCTSEEQAHELKARMAQRLAQCSLARHPTKTQSVSCKDADRQGTYAQERFDFLG
jgi:RNA-directed DNA polymerase